MKIRFIAFALLGLTVAGILFVNAATPTASAASAEQFLRGLYAAYGRNNPTPFIYPEAKNIVDTAMFALLEIDHSKAKGEIGALDFDPVCRCQGWDALKVISLQATMQSNNTASADVLFTNTGSDQKVHFSLVWMHGSWRIHDIGTDDQPSLVAYLRDYKY